MNNPEHILVDVFGTIVTAAKTALGLSVLNYQYGYVRELNETLIQMSEGGEGASKYPLIWLVQPFTISRRSGDYYGEVSIRFLIITSSVKDLKAKTRMADKYKTVLYPIYRTLITEIKNSGILTSAEPNSPEIEHRVTDRYYWGEEQQSVLNDIVDCLDVDDMKLKIYNNLNC